MSWEQEKPIVVATLRKYGYIKFRLPIPIVKWTVKFSVLADQIEKYT